MKTEIKHLQFELKLAEDGTRKITGYGAIFGNIDSYGDVIQPGAFADWIAKGKLPKMLAQHDWYQVVGKWTVIREDEKGLYLEGELADTPLGNEYYTLLKMEAIDGLSIGYRTEVSEMNKDGQRILLKLSLMEVSIVTFPANEVATVTSVKSRPASIRETEKRLRDAGFSREDAKTAARATYEALGLRDAESDEENAVKEAAERFATQLTNTFKNWSK